MLPSAPIWVSRPSESTRLHRSTHFPSAKRKIVKPDTETDALEEINRCATQLMVKGLKLHFNGSGVDLLNFRHAETVRRVFQAVNERRLAMVVHARGDLAVYGREHAEKFLDLLSAARDVPVQVAHLWGGEGFSDAALATYASAVSNGDARTKNLYFDVADIVRFIPTCNDVVRRTGVHQVRPATLIFASWNQIGEWLGRLESLRQAA